jgi:hypothetical protein
MGFAEAWDDFIESALEEDASERAASAALLLAEPGTERTFDFGNGIEMRFCWVPATTSAAHRRSSGGKDIRNPVDRLL